MMVMDFSGGSTCRGGVIFFLNSWNWTPCMILTCLVHGLLQETALATMLKLKIFNVSYMF